MSYTLGYDWNMRDIKINISQAHDFVLKCFKNEIDFVHNSVIDDIVISFEAPDEFMTDKFITGRLTNEKNGSIIKPDFRIFKVKDLNGSHVCVTISYTVNEYEDADDMEFYNSDQFLNERRALSMR